jgi:hypothetical protein
MLDLKTRVELEEKERVIGRAVEIYFEKSEGGREK